MAPLVLLTAACLAAPQSLTQDASSEATAWSNRPVTLGGHDAGEPSRAATAGVPQRDPAAGDTINGLPLRLVQGREAISNRSASIGEHPSPDDASRDDADTASPVNSDPENVLDATPTSGAVQPDNSATQLPLAPPTTESQSDGVDRPSYGTANTAVSTVISSLAIVLGVFFLIVLISRRAMPRGNAALPPDALEVLGRRAIGSRHYLQLVRVGNKLVLLSVTAGGAEALTEIQDPQEVDRMLALCQRNRSGSVSASFRQVMDQLGREPVRGGFFGEADSLANHDAEQDTESASRRSGDWRKRPLAG